MAEKKGSSKKGDKNKRNQKAGPLQKRARRDVRLAIDPLLDEIRRAQESATRDYERAGTRVGDIYEALRNELAPLGPEYQAQARGISGDLNAALGGLTGLLAPSQAAYEGLAPEDAAAAQAMVNPEAAVGQAGVGMLGAVGAGAQGLLANERSRNLGYQTSARRQVGLDRQALEESFLQDYQDVLDEVRSGRIDVMRDVPMQIMARLDTLREQRRNNRLAQSELELRESIANKQLKQSGKAQRSANRTSNRQLDFAQSEIDRRQNKKQVKGLNQDIAELRGLRQPVIRELRDLREGRTPGELAQSNYDEQLQRKRRRYTRKINKKRKRKRALT